MIRVEETYCMPLKRVKINGVYMEKSSGSLNVKKQLS
jgi:hypothetical protein